MGVKNLKTNKGSRPALKNHKAQAVIARLLGLCVAKLIYVDIKDTYVKILLSSRAIGFNQRLKLT